jgi:hypothetical protein
MIVIVVPAGGPPVTDNVSVLRNVWTVLDPTEVLVPPVAEKGPGAFVPPPVLRVLQKSN